MLYLMLGTIVFLLSFCAVGCVANNEEKGLAIMGGFLLNIAIAIVFAVAYFVFGL